MIRTLEAFDRGLAAILRLCLWLHVAWVLLLLMLHPGPGADDVRPGDMRMRYLMRPYPQTDTEEACLWSIVQGYAEWCHQQGRTVHVLSYWRALGLLPLLLLLLPTLALAQPPRPRPRTVPLTYHVSKSGNDTNTCVQAQNPATPRLTVNQGLACLAGGDTLVIGDGVYSEHIGDTPSETPGAVRPPAGLSWEQPTVIKAVHPRKATLNKPQAHVNYVVFLAHMSTQYISIEGLTLDGRGHGDCVWMGPSSHLRLTGNVITNCGGNGIYGSVDDQDQGGSDHQITHNEIFNIALEHPGPPGMHAIYHTGNHSRIAHNWIHEPCPFYGVHLTSEHGGLHDNVIEHNRVRGCHQQGIVNQGARTVVRNNLLENNGIGISCNGSAEQAVLHNTIYGWHPSPFNPDNYGILDMTGGCTIAHNLILKQDDVSYLRRYIYATVGTPQLSGNLCDAVHPQNCQITVPPGSVVVRDGAAGDLRLRAGSPAIDRVPPLAAVPTDYVSVARPQGSAADIGAYEGTGGVPPVIPPIEPPPGEPPTVTLTSPTADAQVSGITALRAAPSATVVGLQFKRGDRNLGPELTQPPWTYAWDTATATPGPQTLSVSVRDAASVFGHSAPVTVTVVESASPPWASGATPLACVGVQGEGRVAIACVPQAQEGRR